MGSKSGATSSAGAVLPDDVVVLRAAAVGGLEQATGLGGADQHLGLHARAGQVRSARGRADVRQRHVHLDDAVRAAAEVTGVVVRGRVLGACRGAVVIGHGTRRVHLGIGEVRRPVVRPQEVVLVTAARRAGRRRRQALDRREDTQRLAVGADPHVPGEHVQLRVTSAGRAERVQVVARRVGEQRRARAGTGRRTGRRLLGQHGVLRGGRAVDVARQVRHVRRAHPGGVVPARRRHVRAVARGRAGLAATDVEEVRTGVLALELRVQRRVREAEAVQRAGRGLDAGPHAHPERRGQARATTRVARLALGDDAVPVRCHITGLRGDVGRAAANLSGVRVAAARARRADACDLGDALLVEGLAEHEAGATAGVGPRVLERALRRLGVRPVEHRAADVDRVRTRCRVVHQRDDLVGHAVERRSRYDRAGRTGVTGGGEQRAPLHVRLRQRGLAADREHLAGREGRGGRAERVADRVLLALAVGRVGLQRTVRVVGPPVEHVEHGLVGQVVAEVERLAEDVGRHAGRGLGVEVPFDLAGVVVVLHLGAVGVHDRHRDARQLVQPLERPQVRDHRICPALAEDRHALALAEVDRLVADRVRGRAAGLLVDRPQVLRSGEPGAGARLAGVLQRLHAVGHSGRQRVVGTVVEQVHAELVVQADDTGDRQPTRYAWAAGVGEVGPATDAEVVDREVEGAFDLGDGAVEHQQVAAAGRGRHGQPVRGRVPLHRGERRGRDAEAIVEPGGAEEVVVLRGAGRVHRAVERLLGGRMRTGDDDVDLHVPVARGRAEIVCVGEAGQHVLGEPDGGRCGAGARRGDTDGRADGKCGDRERSGMTREPDHECPCGVGTACGLLLT